MTRPAADPLAGIARLLVDGTNLLHALRRGPDLLPPTAVTGRLRALLPPGVTVTLVFDGSPAPGAADRRAAAGIDVRYAGRRSADALIRDLAGLPAEGVLVVTDDRELRLALHAAGARTAGTAWLAERLSRQRLAAPAAGRARPPAPPARTGSGGSPSPEPDEGPRWKPGRGATRKTGNPRRGRRP